MGFAGALTLALPTAGLALVGLGSAESKDGSAFDLFTPATVDPALAARVEAKARERGIRFTPAATIAEQNDRLVTVAVRLDGQIAQAVSVRSTAESASGNGPGIAGLQASRFNLGRARGYQSFARTPDTVRIAATPTGLSLPDSVSDLSMPDLSEFEPARPSREDQPSRLQPRIELGDDSIGGRTPDVLESLNSQTVDLGGSFRVSRNLDVTAGVRYSQENDRLAPLTNSVQDSQAVYLGTQIRF